MSQLNSNKPLTRQPQAPVEIAPWIKPKDLWVPMGGVAKNLARDLDANVYSTNTSFKPGKIGNAIQNASTNFSKGCETTGFTGASGKWYDGLSELTIFAVAESFLDATAIGSTFSHIARLDSNANVSNSQVNLGVQNASGTLQLNCLIATTGTSGWSASSFTNVVASSAIDIKKPTLYIQRFKSGSFNQAGIANVGNNVSFVSSGLVPTGTITTTAGAIDAMQMHIGGLAYPIQQSFYGNIFLVGVLPYSISDADANRLAVNPWQIFKPQKRAIYFNAPTTSLTAELNSDLSGQSTLAGVLSQTIGLTSALNSVSTLNNNLTSSISLASSMSGVSAFSGSLANTNSLTTSLQSTATLSTTAPTLSTNLNSTLSAQATFTGAVTQAQQLSSNFQSIAVLTGATTSTMLLSSAQVANASLTSNLTASTPGGLSSDFFAIATLTGALTTTQSLSTSFVSVSTVTSSVTTALALQATFSATATINSAIANAMAISSSLNGLASLDSNLTTIAGTGLLTSFTAQATFNGQLSLTQSLSSSLVAQPAFLSVLSSSSDYAIPNGTYTLTSKTVKYKLRRSYVH